MYVQPRMSSCCQESVAPRRVGSGPSDALTKYRYVPCYFVSTLSREQLCGGELTVAALGKMRIEEDVEIVTGCLNE